jgi:hypothetical protein
MSKSSALNSKNTIIGAVALTISLGCYAADSERVTQLEKLRESSQQAQSKPKDRRYNRWVEKPSQLAFTKKWNEL